MPGPPFGQLLQQLVLQVLLSLLQTPLTAPVAQWMTLLWMIVQHHSPASFPLLGFPLKCHIQKTLELTHTGKANCATL
jgi:hypothetical protein